MSKICMSFKCASLDYPKVRVEAIGIVIKTLETKGMHGLQWVQWEGLVAAFCAALAKADSEKM